MLFLASQSPRRRELLHQLGLTFEVLAIEVPEQRRPGESAVDYVRRVAREKADAGLAQVAGLADALVIGADTEVVLDGDVFGKPADAADAARMLRRLSGRVHRVLSAVWLLGEGRAEHALSESAVEFAALPDAQIADYVGTGEPFGRAGAYAIQGRAAAFIRHLDGSYSGVMGLPLHETAVLLQCCGFPPFRL